MLGKLTPEETVVVCISKSGGTIETISQYFLVRDWLKASVGEGWHDQMIVVTDERKGYLRKDPNRPRALEIVALPDNFPPSPAGAQAGAAIDETGSGDERPTATYVPVLGRIAAGDDVNQQPTARQTVERRRHPRRHRLAGVSELYQASQILGSNYCDWSSQNSF